MYLLSWYELLVEAVSGLRIPEEKLRTFHAKIIACLFYAGHEYPPPSSIIPSMYEALIFPTLDQLCQMTSIECKSLYSPILKNL